MCLWTKNVKQMTSLIMLLLLGRWLEQLREIRKIEGDMKAYASDMLIKPLDTIELLLVSLQTVVS